MLCEINEAFIHNSCKKTAQLAKVVEMMETKSFYRSLEMNDLSNLHNSRINEVINQYFEASNNIYDDLVNFRKSIINDACTFYGQQYKTTKIIFSDLIRSAVDQYNAIRLENKAIKNEIAELNQKLTDMQKDYENNYKNFMDSVKKQSESCKRDINKSLIDNDKSYREKENALLSKYKQSLQQLSKERADTVNSIKIQIRKLLGREIYKRIEIFDNYKKRITALKSSNKQFRNEYNNVMKQRRNLSANFDFHKKDFIQEIKAVIKPMAKETQNVKRSMALENKSHSLDIQIIHKKLIEVRRKQSEELANIQMQINDIKHQINTSSTQFNTTQTKKNNLNESKRTAVIEQFRETYDMISSFNNETHSSIDSQFNLLNKFFKKMNCNQNENSTILKSEYDNFQSNIKFATSKFTKRYSSEKQGFKVVLTQKEEDFKKFAINLAVSSKRLVKKQQELNEVTKKMINHKSNEYENQRKEYEKSQYDPKIEYLNEHNNKQKIDLIDKREKEIEQLQRDLEKKAESILNNFSHDLEEKQKIIDSQNNFDNDSFTCQNFDFDEETKNHKSELKSLNTELYIANDRLERSTLLSNKTIENLNNQISKLDKEMRLLQRQHTNDCHEIINNIDVQIQFEQVSLNSKIDSLSKLYSEEENQRGVEIIEMLRKLRQVDSRNHDLINKSEKELSDVKLSLFNQIQNLKSDIEKYKNLENDLKAQLISKEKQQTKVINRYELETEQILNQMNMKIIEVKNQIEEEKQVIKQKISEYDVEVEQIEVEKLDNSQIIAKISAKREEIMKDFAFKKQYVEKQILMAKEENDELIQKFDNLYQEEKQKLNKEREEKENEMSQNLEPTKSTINQKLFDVDAKVNEIETKQLELIMQAFDIQSRDEEKQKEKITQKKINEMNEKINEEFIEFIEFLSENRPKKVVEPPPSSRANSSRRRKSRSPK